MQLYTRLIIKYFYDYSCNRLFIYLFKSATLFNTIIILVIYIPIYIYIYFLHYLKNISICLIVYIYIFMYFK